jgi:hypothetical protein
MLGGDPVRRLLKAVVVLGLSCLLLPLAAACGGGASSPSPSSQSTGYLTALHGLELRESQPADVEFRVTPEAVDIAVVVVNPLTRFSLHRCTPLPGNERTIGAAIPLQGNGHTNGGVTAYLLTSPKLSAGWYRFEFTGQGPLHWLAVVER